MIYFVYRINQIIFEQNNRSQTSIEFLCIVWVCTLWLFSSHDRRKCLKYVREVYCGKWRMFIDFNPVGVKCILRLLVVNYNFKITSFPGSHTHTSHRIASHRIELESRTMWKRWGWVIDWLNNGLPSLINQNDCSACCSFHSHINFYHAMNVNFVASQRFFQCVQWVFQQTDKHSGKN